MSGDVYVNITGRDVTCARQKIVEAPNATVVLDYGTTGDLIGVEVLSATSVTWNGKTMSLLGGEECSTSETS